MSLRTECVRASVSFACYMRSINTIQEKRTSPACPLLKESTLVFESLQLSISRDSERKIKKANLGKF